MLLSVLGVNEIFLLLYCLSEEGMDRDKSVENETVSEEKGTEPRPRQLERSFLKGTNKKGQKAPRRNRNRGIGIGE